MTSGPRYDFDVVADQPGTAVPQPQAWIDPVDALRRASANSAIAIYRLRYALAEMINIYWEDGTPPASQPVVIRLALDALRATGLSSTLDDPSRRSGE